MYMYVEIEELVKREEWSKWTWKIGDKAKIPQPNSGEDNECSQETKQVYGV